MSDRNSNKTQDLFDSYSVLLFLVDISCVLLLVNINVVNHGHISVELRFYAVFHIRPILE